MEGKENSSLKNMLSFLFLSFSFPFPTSNHDAWMLGSIGMPLCLLIPLGSLLRPMAAPEMNKYDWFGLFLCICLKTICMQYIRVSIEVEKSVIKWFAYAYPMKWQKCILNTVLSWREKNPQFLSLHHCGLFEISSLLPVDGCFCMASDSGICRQFKCCMNLQNQ